jgi:hypothetical protein
VSTIVVKWSEVPSERLSIIMRIYIYIYIDYMKFVVYDLFIYQILSILVVTFYRCIYIYI